MNFLHPPRHVSGTFPATVTKSKTILVTQHHPQCSINLILLSVASCSVTVYLLETYATSSMASLRYFNSYVFVFQYLFEIAKWILELQTAKASGYHFLMGCRNVTSRGALLLSLDINI